MVNKQVTVTLPTDLIEKVDKKVKEIGYGSSRSGFFKEALNKKLEENNG